MAVRFYIVFLLPLLACAPTSTRSSARTEHVALTTPSAEATTPLRAQPALPRHLAASEIRVAWVGAALAGTDIVRSELDARARADRIWELLSAPTSFDELARQSSDTPSGRRGGSIGVFAIGTLDPTFEAIVSELQVGAISRPFRTPFGWHIVRRDPVEEVHLRSILIAMQGASHLQHLRTKAVAQRRAEIALERIAAGEDFESVARLLSDDPSKSNGGDIGYIAHDQLVPSVEAAAFALELGEISDAIEAPYGFHILMRVE